MEYTTGTAVFGVYKVSGTIKSSKKIYCRIIEVMVGVS